VTDPTEHGAGTPSETVILVVEDNEMNRDALTRRLQRKGFRVVSAVDGPEAIQVAREAAPDLVLLDLSLPLIDGWEVARRLRADADTRSLRIIALTAHTLTGERDRALAAGADDFDTKPVDFARLLEKIETLLARPRGDA
jgi:CheY-like chemotaxis protein